MIDLYARSLQAKELLENETFKAVIEDLSTGLIAQWRGTASGSSMLREQIAAEMRGLDAITARLQGWIDEAKFEAAKVERIERRRA